MTSDHGRVVVTGGAGFLGSHLCRELLDAGNEVIAIDNLITGSLDNVSELSARDGFSFVQHDVSNHIDGAAPGAEFAKSAVMSGRLLN